MTAERSLHRPAGSLARPPWSVELTPGEAGWAYCGLRVADLVAGASVALETGPDEVIVLPLAGRFEVGCAGETARLAGRASVFDGPTDFAYAPPGVGLTIGAVDGGRLAVASARAQAGYPFRRVAAADVAIELRGAGAASREVRNFGIPGAFEADRLIACEVITPAGGWSSWPPHKHDEPGPGETELEELYYYEVADGPSGPGIGYQRVYASAARSVDVLAEVRTGDVVLVPGGWHGPTMAAPGYDLYHLNVMAGPGPERAWRISFDPAHAWTIDRPAPTTR